MARIFEEDGTGAGVGKTLPTQISALDGSVDDRVVDARVSCALCSD
jgi:hypothetical protein